LSTARRGHPTNSSETRALTILVHLTTLEQFLDQTLFCGSFRFVAIFQVMGCSLRSERTFVRSN